MEFEDKMKKAKMLKRVGLACLVSGFGIGGYSMYQLYENGVVLTERPTLAQQAFDCIEKGVQYNEATKVATMPQECYANLQKYKAFNEKPETKEALENIEFYSDDFVRYGPLGFFLVGAIVNGKGRAMAAKAKKEKEEKENGDEDDE